MKLRWLFPLALLTCAAPALAQTAGRGVSIQAGDITLKGTYFPAAKPGPGILLLHQCNRDRKTWDDLAVKLAAVGFHVLTFDLRGFGESGGERFAGLPPDRVAQDTKKWPDDIDAAFAFLVAQKGVDNIRIGAAGASCGVNNAIQLALRHPAVKSLVLLSGLTDEPGRAYLRQSPWLPILGAASDDDGDAVPILRWILAFSRSPRTRFVEYKAAGHGTLMFGVEKGLPPMIVDWFEKTLRSAPVSPAAAIVPANKPSAIEQFWATLTKSGGAARAREMYAEARKRDPSVFLFPEFAVNLYGYERLQARDAKEAVEVFKLNVDAFPDSANVYDSLADGYVAAGEKDLAIQASEKALEMLRTHPPSSGPAADQIRQSSEDRLKKLRGGE